MCACLTLCVLSKCEVPIPCVCVYVFVSVGTEKPMNVAHRYDLQGYLIGQNGGEGGGRKGEREKLRWKVN